MREFGYSPLEFEAISFALGVLTKEDLQRQWLCHMNGGSFAELSRLRRPAIAATGFGLSGIPHMGTLSQILRAIRLQKAGIPVQIVLGDLDAYNGKNVPLERTLELASQYRAFILNLGFDSFAPSILRAQYDSLTTLRTSYLIGRYMDDEMFLKAEEDLHGFYSVQGKVDPVMSYRRKLSLNLMIADFLELLVDGGFDAVLVFLGIDEHQYVNFGRRTIERCIAEKPDWFNGKCYAALYSSIIGGFHGYPKMSKSFPQSGITVDMSAEEILSLIEFGEPPTQFPETNVVYQMISSVSLYDNDIIEEAYVECRKQSRRWSAMKRDYAKHLHQLCRKWHER
ncbi:MAG: hypothetical protein COV08_01275 [Candidatus Vogelbacteria bacterium CG10_big_fil_rev_8_21_14_0_10_49_38]|uniref:Tryptophan--tRNA ligase n=1 Tax=Candidatus Vogelbacteria bacterium CG10_big_fil_rev_8_21_14_0_10_49_38 TaxID=1975043 RepID=A0A2H0RI79_9BACT|nr:MAG: hypothetical protein BK006_01295 [bacterium CG10_49_38]PIR46140.1 MAG: hypothetical protein COV08_01275 [Candidatus Vogelbacteria bacterium CG10_big_fil_rev_8_21_14_0_10_49_38]